MDKKQAVFEQLTLSDFKMWSSTALKTFNNYTIIVTNNSDKIRISRISCGVFVFVAGCYGEFHAVFKHFQNLENLILKILKEKLYLLPCKLLE